jgi:3-deoxy-manno-octulosonate cytidylyltransferase (CMP-KDO synthetase)
MLDLTAVTTCAREIYGYTGTIDVVAIQRERVSDRCAEALVKLEEANNTCYEIVVMVQGEPMARPDMITEAVQPLLDDLMFKW